MKVRVTGHHGYIGSVAAPFLAAQGHEVTGVDTGYYPAATCTPAPRSRACSATSAISARTTCAATTRSSTWPLSPTDPLGDLDPELTFDINERASVRLARAAREAGVGRFIFASSCSMYGVSGEELVTEQAPLSPVTPCRPIVHIEDIARTAAAALDAPREVRRRPCST